MLLGLQPFQQPQQQAMLQQQVLQPLQQQKLPQPQQRFVGMVSTCAPGAGATFVGVGLGNERVKKMQSRNSVSASPVRNRSQSLQKVRCRGSVASGLAAGEGAFAGCVARPLLA